MTTQPAHSWDAVIACHDPAQPTRYYRAYTVLYPASSSDQVSATLHDTLEHWSASAELTLSTQYPLLAISDQHTTIITASSRDFDRLLDFDGEFRATLKAVQGAEVSPSTLELLEVLQDAAPANGLNSPRSTLKVITQLQASAFEL